MKNMNLDKDEADVGDTLPQRQILASMSSSSTGHVPVNRAEAAKSNDRAVVRPKGTMKTGQISLQVFD